MSFLSAVSRDHGMSLFLALLCAETFIFGPLSRAEGHLVSLINGGVFSLLLLVGVLVLSFHTVTRLVSLVIVAIAIVLRWGSNLTGSPGLYFWNEIFTLGAAMCFLVLILDGIRHETPVTRHKIMGAVAAYLLMASAFACVYNLIELLIPGSFSSFAGKGGIQPYQQDTFLYFSISTMTTVGFGDITAIHPLARSLVMLESIVGILYPPVLIGVLVSLHTDLIRDRKGNQT
jgi:hypothetical protein